MAFYKCIHMCMYKYLFFVSFLYFLNYGLFEFFLNQYNKTPTNLVPHIDFKIINQLSLFFWPNWHIGQLPRVSGEDPERIRVDSVVETSVCLFFA